MTDCLVLVVVLLRCFRSVRQELRALSALGLGRLVIERVRRIR